MKLKCNASRSSQLLICCYPNMQVKWLVLALIGHHIQSVQDCLRSKSFDAMQGHMGHGRRHHGCHNPPMRHITQETSMEDGGNPQWLLMLSIWGGHHLKAYSREALLSPKGRLSYRANRPTKISPSKANEKVWRVKSSNAEILECDKQKEIEKLVVGNLATSNGDIVIVSRVPWLMIMRRARARPNQGIPNILNLSGVLPV